MSGYTDLFLWHGIYYQVPFELSGRELTDADLGVSQFEIRSHVLTTRILLAERDAGVLESGTKIHAVRGYATTFRLAAKVDGSVRLYEALPHDQLRRGADLLDIAGRVRAIEFGPGDNKFFTRIENPQRIARLVDMVSAAPIDMNPPWGAVPGEKIAVVITFELMDGTRTSRALDRNRGRFAEVLNVGDQFDRAAEEILTAQWCTPNMLTGC